LGLLILTTRATSPGARKKTHNGVKPNYAFCNRSMMGMRITSWYFAEGTTRDNANDGSYEEWLCLQNPNAEEAHAHVRYILENSRVIERDYVLPPMSRKTYDVNLEIGPNHDVSAMVTCDREIVAERPLYFNYRNTWDGGDVAVGSPSLNTVWHFAEGCTRDGFNTWLCLVNPESREVNANLDYFLGNAPSISRRVTIPPHTRITVDVNLDVEPNRDVSCRVTADQLIAVERPMYFNYKGAWAGGHIGVGVSDPGVTWYFAEGCTR